MIEKTSVVFYLGSIIIYLAAFGIFLSRFSSDRDTSPYGNRMLIAGLIGQTAAIVLRFVSAGRVLAFQPYEILAAVSWFLVLEALVVEYWSGVKIIGLYVAPIASALLMAGWSQYHPPQVVTGILKSNWVITHATLVFVSYGAFFISAGSAVLYLIQDKQIKNRKSTKLMRFLPSLSVLEETSFRAVAIGFTVLTVALGMGIAYASKVWEAWDAVMVTAAGFAWLVFLFYLVARIRLGWIGRKSAYLALFGLGVVLIIHFIVVAYMTNIHTYAGG